jgi:hypothetical protein
MMLIMNFNLVHAKKVDDIEVTVKQKVARWKMSAVKRTALHTSLKSSLTTVT